MRTELEELCRLSFHDFLIRHSGRAEIRWEEGEDPPDYYVNVNGVMFLVEATTLMDHILVGNEELPETQIVSSLWRFIDEVKDIAISQGTLRGTYIVAYQRPITNFGRLKPRIRTGLLKYIKYTKAMQNCPEQIVYRSGHQQCSIEKIHDQADEIHKTGPNRSISEGQAISKAFSIFGERLNEKARVLQRYTQPNILLLYDAYRFAEPHVYVQQANQHTAIHHFHTVFVVRGDNTSFVVCSQENAWTV